MARILVIDDDEQIRRMLRQMLERVGYEVADAPDGDEGIRLYRKRPADVVITDIIMQEKEGLQAIMELRREFPGVKIIAISGGGRLGGPESYLDFAKRFGAVRTFTKPIRKEKLLNAISEVLK